MFANCQLPPEPDVALHAVLARLMANTSALKADPSDGSPVADMHAAVHNYARLFDEPNTRTSPTPAGPPRPRAAPHSGTATDNPRSRRAHLSPPPPHTPALHSPAALPYAAVRGGTVGGQ